MKIILTVLAIMMMAGNVWAQEQNNKKDEKRCFFGTGVNCSLKLDFDWGVGFGATGDSEHWNGTAHVGGWVTPIQVGNNRYIRFAGIGLVFDVYDFANHPAEVRDMSRDGAGLFLTPTLTFVPIQLGPFLYQFSLGNDVKTFGLNRGRLHMVSWDFKSFLSVK